MGSEAERKEYPWRVRLSRRAQGLTLEQLARQVGVTKGALSRYESGDVRVLGDSTLRAVCKALALALPAWLAEAGPEAVAEPAAEVALYYCPTPFCRLNRPHLLPGLVRFMPGLVTSAPAAEVACRFCGATLLGECPECGAVLARDSGVCPACGADYVPPAALDQETMAILQFNTAALAREPVTAALRFWAPLAPRPVPRTPGDAVAGRSGAKVGGPSHGGAS